MRAFAFGTLAARVLGCADCGFGQDYNGESFNPRFSKSLESGFSEFSVPGNIDGRDPIPNRFSNVDRGWGVRKRQLGNTSRDAFGPDSGVANGCG
jgi:hypothetical protein